MMKDKYQSAQAEDRTMAEKMMALERYDTHCYHIFRTIFELHHAKRVLNIFFNFYHTDLHAISFAGLGYLALCLRVLLSLYIVWADRDHSGKTENLSRLALRFTIGIYVKHLFCMLQLI